MVSWKDFKDVLDKVTPDQIDEELLLKLHPGQAARRGVGAAAGLIDKGAGEAIKKGMSPADVVRLLSGVMDNPYGKEWAGDAAYYAALLQDRMGIEGGGPLSLRRGLTNEEVVQAHREGDGREVWEEAQGESSALRRGAFDVLFDPFTWMGGIGAAGKAVKARGAAMPAAELGERVVGKALSGAGSAIEAAGNIGQIPDILIGDAARTALGGAARGIGAGAKKIGLSDPFTLSPREEVRKAVDTGYRYGSRLLARSGDAVTDIDRLIQPEARLSPFAQTSPGQVISEQASNARRVWDNITNTSVGIVNRVVSGKTVTVFETPEEFDTATKIAADILVNRLPIRVIRPKLESVRAAKEEIRQAISDRLNIEAQPNVVNEVYNNLYRAGTIEQLPHTRWVGKNPTNVKREGVTVELEDMTDKELADYLSQWFAGSSLVRGRRGGSADLFRGEGLFTPEEKAGKEAFRRVVRGPGADQAEVIRGDATPQDIKLANQLIDTARQEGGVTIDTQGNVLSSGVPVGGKVPSYISRADEVDPNDLATWIAAAPSDVNLGSWIDDNGTLHVDQVDVLSDEISSLRVAAARGEKAIYNLDTGTETDVSEAMGGLVMPSRDEFAEEVRRELGRDISDADVDRLFDAAIDDVYAVMTASSRRTQAPGYRGNDPKKLKSQGLPANQEEMASLREAGKEGEDFYTKDILPFRALFDSDTSFARFIGRFWPASSPRNPVPINAIDSLRHLAESDYNAADVLKLLGMTKEKLRALARRGGPSRLPGDEFDVRIGIQQDLSARRLNAIRSMNGEEVNGLKVNDFGAASIGSADTEAVRQAYSEVAPALQRQAVEASIASRSGITNDVWNQRANYLPDKPSNREYVVARGQGIRAAEELGISGDDLQAAVWAAARARGQLDVRNQPLVRRGAAAVFFDEGGGDAAATEILKHINPGETIGDVVDRTGKKIIDTWVRRIREVIDSATPIQEVRGDFEDVRVGREKNLSRTPNLTPQARIAKNNPVPPATDDGVVLFHAKIPMDGDMVRDILYWKLRLQDTFSQAWYRTSITFARSNDGMHMMVSYFPEMQDELSLTLAQRMTDETMAPLVNDLESVAGKAPGLIQDIAAATAIKRTRKPKEALGITSGNPLADDINNVLGDIARSLRSSRDAGSFPEDGVDLTRPELDEMADKYRPELAEEENRFLFDNTFGEESDYAGKTYGDVIELEQKKARGIKKILTNSGITWERGSTIDERLEAVESARIESWQGSTKSKKLLKKEVKDYGDAMLDPLHDNANDISLARWEKAVYKDRGIEAEWEKSTIMRELVGAWKEMALLSPRYLTANITSGVMNSLLTGRMLSVPNPAQLIQTTRRRFMNLPVSEASLFEISPEYQVAREYGLGFAGREVTGAGSQLMARGRESNVTKLGRRIGGNRLAKIGKPFEVQYQLAQSIDTSMRGGLWADVLEGEFERRLPELEGKVRRYAMDKGIDLTGKEILPSRNPGELLRYYKTLGFTDGQANRLSRDVAEIINKADNTAINDFVHKAHFSYRKTNVDEWIGKVVPFHYWASRATRFYSEALLRNPVLLVNFARGVEGMSESADNAGFNARQKYWVKIMSGPAGFTLLSNPDSILGITKALGLYDGFTPEGETEIGHIMRWMKAGGFGMYPWLDGVLNMVGTYGDTFEPDMLGIRHRSIVGAVMNQGRAMGIFGDVEPGYGAAPYAEMNAKARETISKWASGFLPDWLSQPVPAKANDSGTIAEATFERTIEARIISANPDMTYQELVDIMNDPNSPQYEKAWKEVAQAGVITQVMNFTLPATVKLRNVDYDVWNAQVSAIYEAAEKQGIRPEDFSPQGDAEFASAYKARTGQEWKPSDYVESVIARDMAGATPEARKFILQESQYRYLGSPLGRQTEDMYYNLMFRRHESTANLDEASAESFANDWLRRQPEQTQNSYTELRFMKGAFEETHPEYKLYKEWQDQMYNIPTMYGPDGLALYRQMVSRDNKNAAAYIEREMARIRGKTSDPLKQREMLDAATTSADMYLAIHGITRKMNLPGAEPTAGSAQPLQEMVGAEQGFGQQGSDTSWSGFLNQMGV